MVSRASSDCFCRNEPRGTRWHLVYFCYILECCDGSFYIGSTDDPEHRLKEHNEGKGADWTANRRPVRLVWSDLHHRLQLFRAAPSAWH